MEGRIEEDDRISKLPEPILHHILSLLLVEDAARLSTLCKALEGAWNTLPYLNFGDDFLYNTQHAPKLVNQTLANRLKQNISVQSFSLELPHPRLNSYSGNWIKTLVACNIKEFQLKVNRPIHKGKLKYNGFPVAIFAAKALNVLRLEGFKLKLHSAGIKFPFLLQLHLSDSFLDQKFIQAVCTSCCNLEDLSLESFNGLASFQLAADTLPTLQRVKLHFCPTQFKTVDIVSTSLIYLHINSLATVNLLKITACKALKSLHLNAVAVTDELLQDIFSSLLDLETVYLIRCNTLKNMKITSHKLKRLLLLGCDNLIDAELDTPNLTSFRYCCHLVFNV